MVLYGADTTTTITGIMASDNMPLETIHIHLSSSSYSTFDYIKLFVHLNRTIRRGYSWKEVDGVSVLCNFFFWRLHTSTLTLGGWRGCNRINTHFVYCTRVCNVTMAYSVMYEYVEKAVSSRQRCQNISKWKALWNHFGLSLNCCLLDGTTNKQLKHEEHVTEDSRQIYRKRKMKKPFATKK